MFPSLLLPHVHAITAEPSKRVQILCSTRWLQKVTKHSYILFDTKGKLLPSPLGTAPEQLCGCHFAPPTRRGNVKMFHCGTSSLQQNCSFSALCHDLYLLSYCKTCIRGSRESNVASNLYMKYFKHRNFLIFRSLTAVLNFFNSRCESILRANRVSIFQLFILHSLTALLMSHHRTSCSLAEEKLNLNCFRA